jgi:hypothetical protein
VARRINVRRRKKTVRTTQRAVAIVNAKRWGIAEPAVKPVMSNTEYTAALNWYNVMASAEAAREYVCDWMTLHGRAKDVDEMIRVPDCWVPKAGAWAARMISNGLEPTPQRVKYIQSQIDEALTHSRESVVKDEGSGAAAEERSIQDKMREKTSKMVSAIHEVIDAGSAMELDVYETFTKMQFPPMLARRVADKFRPALVELKLALAGADPQIKEGYSRYSKSDVQEMHDIYASIVAGADRYSSNLKKLRAPRKKKPVSVEKLLMRLRYLKQDGEYRVASIDPAKIIGARELWTFHTRYKSLTVFRADEHDTVGLSVRGSKIINYSPSNSATFKCGRGQKTPNAVQHIMTGTKASVKKLQVLWKQVPRTLDRMTEYTLLLRTFS